LVFANSTSIISSTIHALHRATQNKLVNFEESILKLVLLNLLRKDAVFRQLNILKGCYCGMKVHVPSKAQTVFFQYGATILMQVTAAELPHLS